MSNNLINKSITVNQFNDLITNLYNSYSSSLYNSSLKKKVKLNETSFQYYKTCFNNWFNDCFFYSQESNSYVAKRILFTNHGSIVFHKGEKLNNYLERGIRAITYKYFEKSISLNNQEFNSNSKEDLTSLVVIQLFFYFRKAILACHNITDYDSINHNFQDFSIFDIGNLKNFLTSPNHLTTVIGSIIKVQNNDYGKEEVFHTEEGNNILEFMESTYDTFVNDFPTNKIYSIFRKLLTKVFEKKYYNTQWGKPFQKQWLIYFSEFHLQYPNETLNWNFEFFKDRIYNPKWDTINISACKSYCEKIIYEINNITKQEILKDIISSSVPILPTPKSKVVENSKLEQKTIFPEIEEVEIKIDSIPLSENYGKYPYKIYCIEKIITIKELYTVGTNENGIKEYKLNFELGGLKYISHSKADGLYTIQLGTSKTIYLDYIPNNVAKPKIKEAEKKIIRRIPDDKFLPKEGKPLVCYPYKKEQIGINYSYDFRFEKEVEYVASIQDIIIVNNDIAKIDNKGNLMVYIPELGFYEQLTDKKLEYFIDSLPLKYKYGIDFCIKDTNSNYEYDNVIGKIIIKRNYDNNFYLRYQTITQNYNFTYQEIQYDKNNKRLTKNYNQSYLLSNIINKSSFNRSLLS